jgi:SAM-dependent methyltransferase
MSSLICRDDIIQGYQTFLGRDPETEEVIELFLSKKLDIWSWISIVAGSEEAKRRQLDRLSPAYMERTDPCRIEVDITPEAMQRLLQHVTKAWSRLGESDPYWSVLTAEKYHKNVITGRDLEQFYCSGARDIAELEAACTRNDIVIDHNCTVLDLGCGVGRIGEHFARRYAHYVGVDISPAHLQLARQRFRDQSIKNAKLALLPDFLDDNTSSFDIFYSLITLQHSPPPVIFYQLRHCLTRLRPGGYAFFQVPCQLYGYEFRLMDYLSRIGSCPDMEMHALPQPHVFRAFAECNVIPIEVLPFPRIGPIGFSYAFLAQKLYEKAPNYEF